MNYKSKHIPTFEILKYQIIMVRCYFFPDVNESGTIDIKDFDLAVQVSILDVKLIKLLFHYRFIYIYVYMYNIFCHIYFFIFFFKFKYIKIR